MKRFIVLSAILISLSSAMPKENQSSPLVQTRVSGEPWDAGSTVATSSTLPVPAASDMETLAADIVHFLANMPVPMSGNMTTIVQQIKTLYGTGPDNHQPLADLFAELRPHGNTAAAIAKRQLNAGHYEQFMMRHALWFSGVWQPATELAAYNEYLNDSLLSIDSSLRRRLVAFNEKQKTHIYRYGTGQAATTAIPLASPTQGGPNIPMVIGVCAGVGGGITALTLLTWGIVAQQA